ncbi:MAG: hypothetical protein DRI32_08540 [Chloroflexi bacterium]|nr:MAG: hypothetical protein DRI32_08540 [Chloroflexota bacterium]
MITFSAYFTLWMGTLALTWAYHQANLPILFWSSLALGTLWTWGLLQFKKRMPIFGLILITLLAVIALFKNIPFGWSFAAALSGLLSYDLSNFRQRLRFASPTEDTKLLQRVHLIRLGVMTFLGITLSTIAMLWQAELTFEWVVFMVLVAVWGISLLVGWVRKNE